MAKRVSFSKKNLELNEIEEHHSVTESALKEYYFLNGERSGFHTRFVGYTQNEISAELARRIDELEKTSSFSLLSALEASFGVDYLLRCYYKLKDPMSRYFRDIYKEKEDRASLEEDILEAWKTHPSTTAEKRLISDFISALKYRNWLAHGRYREPTNWGRKQYYYAILYGLASQIYETLDLHKVILCLWASN